MVLKKVYLQPVDGQSNASCPVVLRAGQYFNWAPVESKSPRAGGFTSPLLLLLIWGFQCCFHQQLCQTLPGPWHIWQRREKSSKWNVRWDHLRRQNNSESSWEVVSCVCQFHNSTFKKKPQKTIVYSAFNQQGGAYHQCRNWCTTEQQLLTAPTYFHYLD